MPNVNQGRTQERGGKATSRQTAGDKLTALYTRLNRDDESIGDSLSIQNQKAMLEKYVAQNGFSNIAHFCDDGFSDGNFNRPDWKQMVEEIDKGNKVDLR